MIRDPRIANGIKGPPGPPGPAGTSALLGGVLGSSSTSVPVDVEEGFYEVSSAYPMNVSINGVSVEVQPPMASILDFGSTASSIELINRSLGGRWDRSTILEVPRSWISIVYGDGLFLALTGAIGNNSVYATFDGFTWSQRSMPTSTNWRALGYGNGRFVAINNTNIVATSTDGMAFTQAGSMPATANWAGVAYGNGVWVAVGGTQIASSTDAVTWVSRTGGTGTMTSITFGNGLFVLASTGGMFWTSSNGIDWTIRYPPITGNWNTIAFGGGRFVAIAGAQGGSFAITATSTDGINWVHGTMPVSGGWSRVEYGNGIFVAVCGAMSSVGGPSRASAYSVDGVTWFPTQLPDTMNWTGLAFGSGKFIAVSQGHYVNGAQSNTIAISGITPNPFKIVPIDGLYF